MNTSRLGAAGTWMVIAMLVMIVIGLAVNIVLTARVSASIEALRCDPPRTSRLPCPAIPTRLLLEDPACAQKLVDAMNATNVRIGAAPVTGSTDHNL